MKLYRADDSVAMPLRHYSNLATVSARSWANVAFDHGPVPLLHDHGSKFSALAGRRLVPTCTRPLRQNSLERLSELRVEYAVYDWIEGRVAVAEPSEYLLQTSYFSASIRA